MIFSLLFVGLARVIGTPILAHYATCGVVSRTSLADVPTFLAVA
jgi:hypothetical protein